MAEARKKKNTSRLSVVISFIFHAAIVAALAFLAAREGYLGKDLKKLAVQMVAKEKPPEKPKEKPPEPKPVLEEPKTDTPKPNIAPQPEMAKAAAPPPSGNAAPVAAPAPAALGAFDFEGGKAVATTSDPNAIYKGFVEYILRSHWIRPDGIDDDNYVAEVEVTVGRDGGIPNTVWKKGSGNTKWDNSVKKALAETPSIGRQPPKGFPEKFLVRFDVQPVTELGLE